MRWTVSAVAVMLCMILSGCSVPYLEIVPEYELWKNYELGETFTVAPGDPILRIDSIRKLPVYTPVDEYMPPEYGFPGLETIFPGQVWYAKTLIEEDSSFIISNPSYSEHYGININPDGTIARGWISLPATEITDQGTWPKEPVFKSVPFQSVPALPEEVPYSGELIYLGIQGKALRFAYREYSDNIARPAFHMELTYDLAIGMRIAFRSISLEILSANNEQLQVTVLEDSDLLWVPR